jgi:hypothetical protein
MYGTLRVRLLLDLTPTLLVPVMVFTCCRAQVTSEGDTGDCRQISTVYHVGSANLSLELYT